MKIVVLNGSPKGNITITMQYVEYIKKKFPEHEFQIFNISQKIEKIETDEAYFQQIMAAVEAADGVLWASPVYIFLFPAQFKRFIELIDEYKAHHFFSGKYTGVLTTSVHFFDHAAHNYINSVCDDLYMKYFGMFSADMDDLLEKNGREKLLFFAKQFFKTIENEIPTTRTFNPLYTNNNDYFPAETQLSTVEFEGKILIVVDKLYPNTNLGRMISKFRQSFSKPPEIVDMSQLNVKGGCLGCVRCGFDGDCIYRGKDQFIDFYETKLETVDVLIFAGAIRDRFLSADWKRFFDRGFFRNHTPSFSGKQLGWIISGPLAQVQNLRQILQAYVEWQRSNLVDIVTDEYSNPKEIDLLLEAFAQRIVDCWQERYVRPRTFLGIGGTKIFRDEVWGRYRFPFKADYVYYKKKGWFDFPQKKYRVRIKNHLLLLISKSKMIRKNIYVVEMKEKMTAKHRRIVEKF